MYLCIHWMISNDEDNYNKMLPVCCWHARLNFWRVMTNWLWSKIFVMMCAKVIFQFFFNSFLFSPEAYPYIQPQIVRDAPTYWSPLPILHCRKNHITKFSYWSRMSEQWKLQVTYFLVALGRVIFGLMSRFVWRSAWRLWSLAFFFCDMCTQHLSNYTMAN